jgi:peptidoglycan hydrolase-like protein with peptidoglycan-binding domain
MAHRMVMLVASPTLMLAACQNFSATHDPTRPSIDGAAILATPAPSQDVIANSPAAADFASLGWSTEKQFEARRDTLVGTYLRESGELCDAYLQDLTRVQRGNDLLFGSLSTIFGSAGAAFTHASVVRPLSALASIASGERAEIDADTFAKLTAQVIALAIRNARARAFNAIQANIGKPLDAWPLAWALEDVQHYHGLCSLNEGITEASASVTAVGPQPSTTSPAGGDTAKPARRSEVPPSLAAATNLAANGAVQGLASAPGSTAEQAAKVLNGALAATPTPPAEAPPASPLPQAPPPHVAPAAPAPAANAASIADAARLQLALAQHQAADKSLLPPLVVDGAVGRATQAALRAFQAAHPPLVASGVVDGATRAALGVSAPATTEPVSNSPAVISLVQSRLLSQALPYPTSPALRATGLLDAPTIAALIVYQASQKPALPLTGAIDQTTLKSLGLSR